MTILEVQTFCYDIGDQYGFDMRPYSIIINKRLKTTLGQVKYERVCGRTSIKAIEFSATHLENATEECVQHTILHELAHAFVFIETGEVHGHDATFKAMCRRLGLENEKSFDIVEYKEGYRPTAKYEIYCTCCGQRVAERHRMCKVVERPETFTASCCGKPLRCEQNW